MVEWAAANLSSSSSYDDDDDISLQSDDDLSLDQQNKYNKSKRRRLSETPEAAIARLTTAYNAAMEAVRALHKASSKVAKDRRKKKGEDDLSTAKDRDVAMTGVDSKQNASDEVSNPMDIDKSRNKEDQKDLESLHRGAMAARTVFEHALLSDPLLMTYAPSLTKTMQNTRKESQFTQSPAKISSDAHKITVKQLAYLTLMNYADLILSCCPRKQNKNKQEDILDRGVVRILEVLSTQKGENDLHESFWSSDENEEESKRLALVSYCDAVDLDGTDPTSWLKLACCARSVGRVVQSKLIVTYNEEEEMITNQRLDNLCYHRLERYALESGLTILRPGIPCNRLIARAYREFEQKTFDNDLKPYVTLKKEKDFAQDTCVIDLPRDNWSTLGRILLKTCKTNQTSSICLKISPMLTLSTSDLGRICEFVGLYAMEGDGVINNDVKNLKATCHALLIDVSLAIEEIEKYRNVRMKRIEQEMQELLDGENNEKEAKVNNGGKEQISEDDVIQEGDKFAMRVSRTSARVQSQLLSSGKQAERSARRQSVEYCLTCSILPFTPDHPVYTTLIGQDFKWETLSYQLSKSKITQKLQQLQKVSVNTQPQLGIVNKSAGKSSIIRFIAHCGNTECVANEVLYKFLAHVSCNINDVCCQEPDMSLTSCIIECFELLVESSATFNKCLVACWFGKMEFPSDENLDIRVAIDTLGVNLLYAELQVRAAELHVNEYCTTFADKIDVVKRMIPFLLSYSSSLRQSTLPPNLKDLVSNLLIRTHWLVSVFYFYWGRRTKKMTDVKDAENQALKHIDNAIDLFKKLFPTKPTSISTPHLMSPGRYGNHWKELSIKNLRSFRDELEASTVLSRCRQNFFAQLADWKKSGSTSTNDLTIENQNEVKSIGKELFKRYSLGIKIMTVGENTDELIDDFIMNHASNLTPIPDDNETDLQQKWPSIWSSVPMNQDPILFQDLSNSSYITIMSLALVYNDESQLYLVSFLSSLIVAVVKYHRSIFTKAIINEVERKIQESNDQVEDYCLVDEENLIPLMEKSSALTGLAHLLLSKLRTLIENNADTKDFFEETITCTDLILITQYLIKLSSGHNVELLSSSSANDAILTIVPPDEKLLKSTLNFAAYIKTMSGIESFQRKLDSSVFVELCRTFVHEKNVMTAFLSKANKNMNRYETERRSVKRSKYVALIASELSGLLLIHPNEYEEASVKSSFLIENLTEEVDQTENVKTFTLNPLAKLVESLTWFWTVTSRKKSKLADSLHISIVCLIVTLLGSAGHANSSHIMIAYSPLREENVMVGGPSDYFESDDSAQGDFDFDSIENDDSVKFNPRKRLLHALCRCVQCIGLVFSTCEDAEISFPVRLHFSETFKGNFLPFVVVRVLGGIGDFVLSEFSDANPAHRLWAEEYPYGFRGAGAQLDALLYKAYRCLHGINLSAQSNHFSTSKDYAIPAVTQGGTSTSFKENAVLPESILASARLYRCIMRAYAGGRRTIPQDALECVLSAIPSTTDNSVLTEIKTFLFHTLKSPFYHLKGDTSNIDVSPRLDTDAITAKVPNILRSIEELPKQFNFDIDALKVRKGICKYFTEGPLPSLGSSTFTSKPEESKIVQERELASEAEKAVHKKFMFIIESLQYEPDDASKWYRAGLCLGVKIDIILDRLLQSRRGYNANDFYMKKFRSVKHRDRNFRGLDHESLSLNELLEKQFSEYKEYSKSKERLFSDDLSIYLEHQWSCFSSLEDLSILIGKQLREREKTEDFAHWCSIQSNFDEGRVAEWQSLWGKMFVGALQSMREKCFHAAFHLSMKQDITDKGNLHPEIAESLGTMYYSDIGFSQKNLTAFEIREQAKLSQSYFERALSSILELEDEDDLADYELQVMIGKCHEKIAKTLESEAFSCNNPRKYEIAMSKALECYNKALSAARRYEKEHGNLDSQGGGSAHGICELIYRLHASRLKVLLKAVRKSIDERTMAEIEALKLTEMFWHEKSNDTHIERNVKDVRERVWAVLADVVECMVYCRREHPFFHRSVYRHAQALLWAPLFHDPDGSIKEGSNDTVPAYKSYKLRGLSSGSCAASAEVILNTLFDKKRPQLCAVWVTTPQSPSPFEYINDSSRKFDRLRWKYVGAFIDCMKLCGRISTLETLIKWCNSSCRDLPSFYIATAIKKGETPSELPGNQNMLLTKEDGLIYFSIKYANEAIAAIIRREAISLSNQHANEDESKKKVHELMKDAYKCFLRLNCPMQESLWQSRKARLQMASRRIPEVESLCISYITLKNIDLKSLSKIPWDHKILLLRSVIKDCENMFPAITLKSTCTIQKRKRKMDDTIKNQKEKDEIVQRKIVVKVPKNVHEGDKFIVEVYCEYFRQRVQLLSSGSKKILFHLDIPKNITSDINVMYINEA